MTQLRAFVVCTAIFVATLAVHAQDVRETIGPLEQSARPSSPENPAPRRTFAPPAAQIREWGKLSGRGTVRLRATVDSSGRVAEIRTLMQPLVLFPQGVTADAATRQAIAEAMVKSAAAALSRWRYAPPEAPITFPVGFTFSSGADPIALQETPGPLASGGGGPLPAWPAAQGIARIDGRTRPPTLTKKVNPEYPKAGQVARVSGQVGLEVIIGADGKVSDLRVVRSDPFFDKAAVDAVRQWEYAPTVVDGKAIPVVMSVSVSFSIDAPGGGIGPRAAPFTITPWPAADGAVRVGGNIKPPRQTKNVRPVYPIGAQVDRTGGAVLLELLIGPDGKVKDVRVVRPSPMFEKEAIEATRTWEYEPTIVNGMPVSVVMPVTVMFAIK